MEFPEELYQKCLRHVRKVGEGADEEVKEEEDEDQDMEAEPKPIVTTDVDGKPLDIKMRPRPKFVNRKSTCICINAGWLTHYVYQQTKNGHLDLTARSS